MDVTEDEDGTTIFRDGPWTLVDPRTTFGEYRQFDGWWREPSTDELEATKEPAHPEG